ncbi:MAG: hypothetical protein WC346_14655, partial [Methanogenium sp.]
MPKFSEIPFYIIKEFFLQKEIDGSYKLPVVGQLPPSGTCTLHGQNTGISTLGGYGIEIYLKTSNNYYMLKGLYSVSSEDLISNKFYSREGVDDSFLNNGKTNKFVFQLLPSASDYRFRPSEFNMVELFPAPSDENYSGSDVYFRRGTLIYDYIISRGYDSFINVNKPFLYFGKLWKGEVEGTIEIESNHFKDYVYRCLPTINRSDNYDEYIGVAFDGVYNKTYNMLKNLQTFPDAYEIDEKYLMYLRETFNVPSVGSDITERTYLKYIVSLLKRKGTYTYIYAIWKIVNQTSNTLNIYERWHDPLPPSSCPYPYFEDHLYTKNRLYHDTMLTYNPVPSGGAGHRYYRTTYPCNVFGGTYYGLDVPYPVYGFEDYAYDVSTVMATLSASTMTFDFDYLTEWLMMHNKFTPFIFGQMWVNDSGEFFQAQPGESFPLTENIYEFKLDEPDSGSGTLAVPDFVHSHPVKEEEWTIIHTLGVPSATLLGGGQYVNEIYPLVIVTDRDHKQIMPDRIYKYDEDTTIIEFDEYKVNGYVLFKRPDYEHVQHYPSDTWVVNHGLGDTILAQVYDDSWPNENVIHPSEIKSDNNVATITFPVSCAGRVEICDVVTRPREWNFVHHLDSDEEFVMVQTWDENLYNFWPTETLSSGATCTQMKNTSPSSTHVYFDSWQPGYAMAASADYYHTQSTPATAWNIEHNLLTDWPVVNIIDESYDYLAPSAYTIEFIDENNLHVTFNNGSDLVETVVASGTTTSGSMKISLATSASFINFSTSGNELTNPDYLGLFITITGLNGKSIKGVIGQPGTIETYGQNIGSDFDTWVNNAPSGFQMIGVSSAVNYIEEDPSGSLHIVTDGSTMGIESTASVLVSGGLYRNIIDITSINPLSGGIRMGSMSSGSQVFYTVSGSSQQQYFTMYDSSIDAPTIKSMYSFGPCEVILNNWNLEQVLSPASSGVLIMSDTTSAAIQSWSSIDPLFAWNEETYTYTITSIGQKGYAAIAKPDEIISVPVPISSYWFVHHNLFTDFNLITVWDGSTEKTILPTSIRHYKWANSIALEFDSDYYGYVSLKSATSASQYLQRVHNLGKILSTHVEIEIDLTNEPLEKNDIIYKDRLDKMITLWDHLRPVSRVYHYSMVISQELDFSGNKAALYPYSSDVNFTTKFLSTPIDPITSSFVEIIQNPTESVYILHNLKSLNVVIQCFDTNNNMIEPLECFPVNEDTSKITFEEPFTGTICATKAETVVDMSTYSISSGEYDDFYVWDVSAAPIDGKFDHIPQITNYDRYRVLPESIESQNPSSSKWPTVWFSPSSSPIIPDEKWIISGGHYIAVSGSKIEFFAPDDNVGIVNIIHNLDGNAFQVAVFNDSHELIYPENIHIYNNNRIQLQFDTSNLPLNGYAIVRKISNEAYGTKYTFS